MFQGMTPPFRQLRILVAENDHDARRLIAQTLEKMGLAVVLAKTGKEVVESFVDGHFDLIFLSLELLAIDAFATSVAIRHHENAFDDHVPIIAMTTSRHNKEREHCLNSGMDSYIERPASAYQIQTAMLAFTNPESLHPSTPPLQWDRTRALQRVGGDETLLAELIAIFAQQSPQLLGQMDRALRDHKPGLLRRAARELQEKLIYLGAFEVSETARRLGAFVNPPDYPKATELAAVLRFQLAATDAIMCRN